MQRKTGKTGAFLGGFITVLLGILVFIYWSGKKEVWFCDEIYSYESANGFEQEWPDREPAQWISGKDVEKFFAADSESLNLSAVTNRLYADHVPMYFWIFRIVSFWLFRGSGTVWIGLLINLVFYLCLISVLYFVFCKITGNPIIAGGIVLLNCCINRLGLEQALTLRMYEMLLWGEILYLLCCFFLLHLYTAGCGRKKKGAAFLCLLVVSVTGLLTHYDFWIFYAVSTFLVCLRLLILAVNKAGNAKEHWKNIFKTAEFVCVLCWGLNFALALLIADRVFPYWKWNLRSGKGEKAFLALFHLSGEMFQRIAWGYQRFLIYFPGKDSFWVLKGIFVITAIIGGAVILYKKKRTKQFWGLLLSVFSAQIYQIVVCVSMPTDWEERYLWSAFSIMYLCVSWGVVLLIDYFAGNKAKAKAFILIVFAIFLFAGNIKEIDKGNGIVYLRSNEKNLKQLIENRVLPWVVYGQSIEVYSYYDWMIPDQICFLSREQSSQDAAAVRSMPGSGKFLLYVYEELLPEAKMFIEQEYGSAFSAEYLTKSTSFTVYFCEWIP